MISLVFSKVSRGRPALALMLAGLLLVPAAQAHPPGEEEEDTSADCVYMLVNHHNPNYCIPRFPPTCGVVVVVFYLDPPSAWPYYQQGCVDEWNQYLANVIGLQSSPESGERGESSADCVYMLVNHYNPHYCIPRIPPTCDIVVILFDLDPPSAWPYYQQGCVDEWNQYLANIIGTE